MARTVTGADIGLRTAKFLRGAWKGNTFHAADFAVVEHKDSDVAGAWERCELPFKPRDARIGLTGRDVNIRYTRVPQVPDWQLRKLMRFEVEEIGEQSGSEVASDFNLLPNLPELEGEDVVLLAMARESLLESHLAGLSAIGGTLDGFSPNALALYNAWTHFGVVEEETVMVASLGHENLDVILVRGPDLLFARNLSGGARLFDDAIAERLGVSAAKAEELKIELADLEPGARYRDANQEKTSRACLGAAGQLLSLLQSTVMFCKSQVKVTNLRVDRVLLCGGGAALKGLPKYLSSGMGVPVDLFDPFRVVDTSALASETAERLEHYKLEAVIALGLATMASDPEGYSVEILPARLRRRREFLGGTAWLIAAAALAVLFLGFEAWSLGTRKSTVESEVRQLEASLRRATSTDRRVRELLEENARLAEAGTQLAGVAGSGEQLARTIDGLQRVLPGGFWIDSLSSDWRSDERLRLSRDAPQPVVNLVGRAQEGTESIASQMQTFVERLRERLPGVELVYQPSPSGDRFTLDLTLFAPPLPAEEPAGAEPPDDDEDEPAGGQG
jgi:Tfp pilus assembly PilM family ATPase/Tfp pilus assembly protein PilN